MTPPTSHSAAPTLTKAGYYQWPSSSQDPYLEKSTQTKLRYPVVATDHDGDSVYLGSPVAAVIEDAVGCISFSRNPQAYLLGPVGQAPGPGRRAGLITISRWQEFTSSLKLETGMESTHSTTKKTANTEGWSTEADVGASFSTPHERRELGVDFSNQFKSDWESEESEYNTNLLSGGWTFETETTWDDGIKYDIQMYDVWRYPVYGYEVADAQGNPLYGYMDIIVPYSEAVQEYMGPAANVDGWEPTWENGNILSYPRYEYASDEEDLFHFPPDLGVFYIPAPGHTRLRPKRIGPDKWVKKIEEVMGYLGLSVGGTADTQDFTLSGSEGSGQEQTYSESMTESYELKAYYEKNPSEKTGRHWIRYGGRWHIRYEQQLERSQYRRNQDGDLPQGDHQPACPGDHLWLQLLSVPVRDPGWGDEAGVRRRATRRGQHRGRVLENIYGDSWTYGPGKPDPASTCPIASAR